ncbi:hypothetical protein SAY87_023268 [Trapa incisa]|uniref:Uncharacterized protein n=1 Tax=Trapa incisa TaxID=236973 RepID=A0AAN7K5Q9_9MYRT|nr:hypothetical protein SAY87_023268 [Trapa incisa]
MVRTHISHGVHAIAGIGQSECDMSISAPSFRQSCSIHNFQKLNLLYTKLNSVIPVRASNSEHLRGHHKNVILEKLSTLQMYFPEGSPSPAIFLTFHGRKALRNMQQTKRILEV